MTSAALTVDLGHLQLAMLGVARLSGLLFLTPPFDTHAVPARLRICIAVALILPVWPLLVAAAPPTAPDAVTLLGRSARELVIGLSIGFVARLVMAAGSFASELISLQIGFGLATVLDPAMGAQVTVLTRLYEWTLLGLFLSLDMHHLVLGAALESFRVLPIGDGGLAFGSAGALVDLGSRVFTLGLALVAPTLGILFILNLVLALASRALPQLQLMVVAWPITVLVGLSVLLGNVDLMSGVLAREMAGLEQILIGVLRSLAGG
jgi:flagellar biosynthetic protein FliR